MKILFVSSGNKILGISTIVKTQGESLVEKGMNLQYFTIKGKGIKGYLKNYKRLKVILDNYDFDLVHSHYFLSSILASFTKKTPLVVSLMGSDAYHNQIWRLGIILFNLIFWDSVIVKSSKMKYLLNLKKSYIIPNGVNIANFNPITKDDARTKLGLSLFKKYILFASNPDILEKNFNLAKNAVSELNRQNVELIQVFNKPIELMPYYFNAVDVLLLTSNNEGSPNVIKEAMACNIPIVSTNVGDVKEIIGNTEGCYITSYDSKDVADKLELALSFGKRTNGREYIQHLSSEKIAVKIIELYKKVVSSKKQFHKKSYA
ncbi:MAG: glycosyltransferase family 4 protein [Bacteroidetes bacterium]|nr:glycosyltransferase family 4 protein [Bacteroidota bacterium]